MREHDEQGTTAIEQDERSEQEPGADEGGQYGAQDDDRRARPDDEPIGGEKRDG